MTQCFKQKEMLNVIFKKVGKMIQRELIKVCSNKFCSTLLKNSKQDLLDFSFNDVIEEMEASAPILWKLLLTATRTKRDRPNQDVVIAMCTSMLCKLRRADMSTAQKMVSLILYAGHSSKQVI